MVRSNLVRRARHSGSCIASHRYNSPSAQSPFFWLENGDRMINENALRDALVNFAEISKRQDSLLVDLIGEIAALEQTIRGLDPTFAVTFAQRRKEAVQKALASSQTALAQHDQLIQKMKTV